MSLRTWRFIVLVLAAHVAGFAAQIAGYCLLVRSVLVDTPSCVRP